jgi:lipopolysaccharide biosynthesis regulator YciM
VSFSSERVYTEQEQRESELIKNYYDGNVFDKKTVSSLTFGGSCANFTYSDFIESAIEIYQNENYWKECLDNAHKIIKKHQNEQQVEIVLKQALVATEMMTLEGRNRKPYEEEWKRYIKSEDFQKKLKNL